MITSPAPLSPRRDNYPFVRLASSINICRTNENDNYFIGYIKSTWPTPPSTGKCAEDFL